MITDIGRAFKPLMAAAILAASWSSGAWASNQPFDSTSRAKLLRPGDPAVENFSPSGSAVYAETGGGTPFPSLLGIPPYAVDGTGNYASTDSINVESFFDGNNPDAGIYRSANANSATNFVAGTVGAAASSTPEAYGLGKSYVGDYVSFAKEAQSPGYVDFTVALHGTAFCCDAGADKLIGQGWEALYQLQITRQNWFSPLPPQATTQYLIGTSAQFDVTANQLAYSPYNDSYTDGFQFGGWQKGTRDDEVIFFGRLNLPIVNTIGEQTSEYLISHSLSVLASGGTALFGSTATLGFSVSEGVTFTSSSGNFLAESRLNAPVVPEVGSAVPEPASWAMMVAGVWIVGGAARRKRRVIGKVTFA